MGYQFLHVECYARSAGKGKAGGHSIRSVIAEASRQDEATRHLEETRPPVHLFGCPLDQVESLAEAWALGSKDAIGRSLRKDGLCLLAGVVSVPDDMAPELWEPFKADVLAFLNRDGRLVCAVEHTDEPHRHFHYYKVAQQGARFETLHHGRAAALGAKAAGLLKGQQNSAYKKAMRVFQEDFFTSVGSRYGLARIGPANRRLTRSAWNDEQSVSRLMGETLREAADAEERAKAETERALAAADRSARLSEKNAATVAAFAKSKSAVLAEIKAERSALAAAKSARFGGWVGAFLGSAWRAVVRMVSNDREARIAAEKAATKAKAVLKLEVAKREAAERQAQLEKVGREVATKAAAAIREQLRALTTPSSAAENNQIVAEIPTSPMAKRQRFR